MRIFICRKTLLLLPPLLLLSYHCISFFLSDDDDNNSSDVKQSHFLHCPRAMTTNKNGRPLKDWSKILSSESVMERIKKTCDVTDRIVKDLGNKEPEAGKRVPMAFSLTVHNNLGILEVLLSLIFRPYHTICISVDERADRAFKRAVIGMINCYKKRYPESAIFLSSEPISVYWGHISLLQSDLSCLRQALDADAKWVYFMNLAGSELPAMDMDEMEDKISKGLKGRSLAHGSIMPDWNAVRIKFVHVLDLNSCDGSTELCNPHMTNTLVLKSPPPHGLKIYKGLKNVLLNRTFSEYVLSNPVSTDLLDWLLDSDVPDESFYTTLLFNADNNNNDSNGSKGAKEEEENQSDDDEIRIATRYSQWEGECNCCYGMILREICQFSLLDLPNVADGARSSGSLFVNKFNVSLDALAVACWAERVLN